MSEQLTPQGHNFDKIISIIEDTRSRALRAVNAELIRMYWDVGEYLSDLCANATFGDKVIDEVASYIAQSGVKVKGFNRRGLYRMKQFYETYRDDEFVTPLVTQINWTNHLQIMSSAKSMEERHFYLQLCAKEHYSKRELERQIDSAYYERCMLSAQKPVPEMAPQNVRGSILDTYVLEFLDLPEQYSERNFKKAIIENLKQFILEFGRDFSFVGEEYRVQVGNTDFYIDYSDSTNPIIWGCIFYALAGITFANLLIFHLLFLAANFLSIKIVSQRSGKCNCIPSHFAELLIEGRSISFLFQQYPFQSVGAYCPCTLINRHSADTIIFEEHIAALPNQSVQELLCTVWM